MVDSISKAYAFALLDSLKDNKYSLDSGYLELTKIIEIIKDEKIYKFLVHPNIEKQEKNRIINEAFASFNKTIVSFIDVLIENNRIDRIDDIAKSYLDYLDDINGLVRVEVITNKKLSSDLENKLIATLEKSYQKKVIATYAIDESIIGGIIVKRGGYVVDDSIINKIKAIKDSILFGE